VLSAGERGALLAELARLVAQVEALQAQLNALQANRPRPRVAGDSIFESRFYDGPFEAIYRVDDTSLSPQTTRVVRVGDQLFWNTLVTLVGADFIEDHLVEYRIFNDPDNYMGAFIEQNDDLEWILAINRFDEDLVREHDDPFMIELLLHEMTHIPFFADEQYEDAFTEQFWDTSTMRQHERRLEAGDLRERTELADRLFERYPDHFVTAYAATSPVEDLVESFVEFVVSDAKPEGQTIAEQKVRFFYDYPELVSWRSELRASGLF